MLHGTGKFTYTLLELMVKRIGAYSSHMECVGMYSPNKKTGFVKQTPKLPTNFKLLAGFHAKFAATVSGASWARGRCWRDSVGCSSKSQKHRMPRGLRSSALQGNVGIGLGGGNDGVQLRYRAPKNLGVFFDGGRKRYRIAVRRRPFFSQYINSINHEKVGSDNKVTICSSPMLSKLIKVYWNRNTEEKTGWSF